MAETAKTPSALPTSEAPLLLDNISFGVVKGPEGQEEEITAARVVRLVDWKVIRVLGELPPFLSDEAMKKFVEDQPDLTPFRRRIPLTDSVHNRVVQVLAYFRNCNRSDGRNGLEIFLRALAKAEKPSE